MNAYNDLFIQIEHARTEDDLDELSDEIQRASRDQLSFTEQLLLTEELMRKRLQRFERHE